MTAEPQREWKSRPSGRSPDPREDGSPQTDGSFVGLPGPSPCATCPLMGNASGEPGMAPPRRPLPSLPRSTQHLRETRRPTGTRAEEAAWWGGSPGSPGPDDGLAGIPGARVVCAVEVEPQQDLAPPLGLGVQDLDTGSHPGQRCIGARPAGQSRVVYSSRQRPRAVHCSPQTGAGICVHGGVGQQWASRGPFLPDTCLLQLGPPQGAGGPGPGPKPLEAATPTQRSTVS